MSPRDLACVRMSLNPLQRMCRDILESCVRNTEEAEKASHAGSGGRGEAKGVWGMLEQSELAKSIREDDKKKVDEQLDIPSSRTPDPTDIHSPTEQTESDIVAQARARKTQLEEMLARVPSSSSSSAPPSPVASPDPELIESTREMMKSVVSTIERTTDPTQLESLLALNDDLMALLGRLEPKPEGLKLQGLGIQTSEALGNGNVHHAREDSASPVHREENLSDDDEPITPRVDKGKGRADPEPEPIESVLSPTFLISESDDEDGEGPPMVADLEALVSPTDLYVYPCWTIVACG